MEFLEKLRRLPGFLVLRAIIYLRISTDREEEYSTAEQLFDCEEFANKWGIEVVAVVEDRGLSGGTFEKRKIGGILSRVGNGEANIVLVALRDRWGRDPDLNKEYERHLQAKGGYLIAARRPLDMTTSQGRTQAHTDDFIAGLQRHQIGDNWQNTVKRRRRNGLPHTAAPRMGYKICPNCTMQESVLENGKIRRRVIKKCGECGGIHVLDQPRADALKEFCTRWTLGGESGRKVAFDLECRGVTSVRGNKMSASQWFNVLDTGYAAGWLRSRTIPRTGRGLTMKYKNDRIETYDTWVRGKQPIIIKEDLWSAYKKKRGLSEGKGPGAGETKIKYAYSGNLRCGRPKEEVEDESPWPEDEECLCMAPMNSGKIGGANTKRKKEKGALNDDIYRCESAKAKRCKGITIGKHLVDSKVLQWLTKQSMNDGLGRAALAQAAKERKALDASKQIQADLKRLEKKLLDFLELKNSGEIHPVSFKLKEAEIIAQMSPLQAQLDYLSKKSGAAELPPREEFVAIVEAWPKLKELEKRTLLEPIISHIVVFRVPGKRANDIRIVPTWEAKRPVPPQDPPAADGHPDTSDEG